jgi:uncharacterized cupredoxin-like copper-binding protein
MAIDEQSLATPRPPRSTGAANGKDTTSVVAVIIASVAMVAALASIGLAARAVNERNRSHAESAVARAVPASLAVSEHDFAITPRASSIGEGVVDLRVTNAGPSQHELLIFRTDLAPDQLPLGPDGRVDEGGEGVLKVFDSGNNIDVGATTTFHTALAAGRYVLVCNLPGHYRAGMHTAFTVTGTSQSGTATTG